MKRIFLLGLCAVLTACTTVGNGHLRELRAAEGDALLQPGHTTRAEVERLLGIGVTLRFESGWTTTRYVDRQGLPRALDFIPVLGLITSKIDAPETELLLLFDPDGVLRKFKERP
jgi:hypothetical protein